MKFENLYNQVFLSEQDEETQVPTDQEEITPVADGTPEPDTYEVEPLPVSPSGGNVGDIQTYKTQLIEFADTMQTTEGSCLQKLVNDLDRPGSLFQGISRELSSRIIKIASDAKDIATILDGFVINSEKRKRDIASGQ